MSPLDFHVDASLKVDFTPSTTSDPKARVLTVRIIHAFTPFTMSPVLQVFLSDNPSDPSLPSNAILKLYDRRCMTNVREMYDEEKPHDAHKEQEYKSYHGAINKAAVLDFDDPLFFEGREVPDGEFEGYIEHQCRTMFNAEVSTYRRLQELQGQLIPRLYGTVEYILPPITVSDGTKIVLDPIPGILIEYIPSITLRTLVQTWSGLDPPLSLDVLRYLSDSATAIIERISDFEILNEDVRLDNMLVRQPLLRADAAPDDGTTAGRDIASNPCVLIDLAQCRLRLEGETDDEWVSAKWNQDEAGAVGFVLAGVIKKHLGEGVWTYKRNLRYYRPLEE